MSKVRLTAAAVSFIFIAFMFGALVLWLTLPDITVLDSKHPRRNLQVPRDVYFVASKPNSWVSLHQISPHLRKSVILNEDWNFYHHQGLDWYELKESIRVDLEAGSFKRGASTITQQLAKNVFLSNDKNLVRKAREIILAFQLEKKYSKNKLFEVYLNIVQFGKGLYGIGAAAQYYFDSSPAELSVKESAFLAMLLPSPEKYAVSFHQKELTPFAQKTIRSTLRKMVKARYLSAEESELAWQQVLWPNDEELEESVEAIENLTIE